MVDTELPAVEDALPAVRALFRAVAVPFKFAGGVAVVHHGYVRATCDVDVLLDSDRLDQLDERLAEHGFVRERRTRLRHVPSGTPVDLLPGGEAMPRPGSPSYPRVGQVRGSESDPDVLSLSDLIHLKLLAHRYQDVADVVALLKRLDEPAYLTVESALPAALRGELGRLRQDALDELAYADD